MDQALKDQIKAFKGIQLAKNYLQELDVREQDYVKRKYELENLASDRLKLIDRLSGTSLLGGYMKLTGQQEEALETSRQYYFDLLMELDEITALLEKIDFDRTVLRSKVEGFPAAKAALKEAIQAREEELEAPRHKKLLDVLKSIDEKLGLIKEFEEAIFAGNEVNQKFGEALACIKRISNSIYNDQLFKDEDAVLDADIRGISEYQSFIINIRHSMLKFEAEVNDIYNYLFKDDRRKFGVGDNFLMEHRITLFADLKEQNSLLLCYDFLTNQRKVIKKFARTLRSDLTKLNNELQQAEQQETELWEAL